jgi:hypothetical protein
MRKYAALTALGIALITMLALTVTASLTPANAGLGCPGNSDAAVTAYAHMFGVSRSLVLESCCSIQCGRDAIQRVGRADRDDKKYQACLSKCVNAAEAARRH